MTSPYGEVLGQTYVGTGVCDPFTWLPIHLSHSSRYEVPSNIFIDGRWGKKEEDPGESVYMLAATPWPGSVPPPHLGSPTHASYLLGKPIIYGGDVKLAARGGAQSARGLWPRPLGDGVWRVDRPLTASALAGSIARPVGSKRRRGHLGTRPPSLVMWRKLRPDTPAEGAAEWDATYR